MLRARLLLTLGIAASLVALVGACSDQGDEGGDDPHFILRTVSGGTFDAQGMTFAQCSGDPSEGYTKIWTRFDGAGSTTVQSQHQHPDCSDPALDAAQFDIEGGTLGDITIVAWEPGYQPAHIEVPLLGTRVEATLTGEDGQTIVSKSVLLVDDGVDPPRVYSGREVGPLDAEGFPTTMWNDFLDDQSGALLGTWIATASGQVVDLAGSGAWTRCVFDDDAGVYMFETWSFENDRLALHRHDNGDDADCGAGTSGAGGGELAWVVLVERDIEQVEWIGAPPPGIAGPITATHVQLWDNAQIGSRLLLLDDTSDPPTLYVSADAEGFTPDRLDPLGLSAG